VLSLVAMSMLISVSVVLGSSSVCTLTLKVCCCDGVSCMRGAIFSDTHVFWVTTPLGVACTESQNVAFLNQIRANGERWCQEVDLRVVDRSRAE
jgi:hypothetical protein